MSMEAARAFLNKMKTDQAFRCRVLAVEDVMARLDLVKESGFDFNLNELEAVRVELSPSGSDDEDRLAGCGDCCANWGVEHTELG